MNLLIPLTCQSCGGQLDYVEPVDGTPGTVERVGMICAACRSPHVVTVTLRHGIRDRAFLASYGDGR